MFILGTIKLSNHKYQYSDLINDFVKSEHK